MEQKSNKNSVFLATTSFIGGIAVGLLLSPKSGDFNRTWLSDRTSDLGKWIDKQRQSASKKSSSELQRFRNNVQQGIRQNIPDLYEATEDIGLSDNNIQSE